jgi:beta-glucosidase
MKPFIYKPEQAISEQVDELLALMTLTEKIGQLSQFSGDYGQISAELQQAIIQGKVGSIINEVDPSIVNQLQTIALEQSRLGIPLLIGRDVIHGFKTIFPIPLGQAASFNNDLVEQAARVAAHEASQVGINWTFAPMIDITRDPRWGRVAECLGEDPLLCAELGKAMVRGFQGSDLTKKDSIAACAKHFAGYGACESGRDYNTASIPENELRNVYLKPFEALAKENVASFMSAFNELNGVPASGNQWLLNHILREEWQYNGVVVSDWESISQLTTHGFTANDKQAACAAFTAGVDMEMVSKTYQQNLPDLLAEHKIDAAKLDIMVARILTLKFNLGLFDKTKVQACLQGVEPSKSSLALAKQLALESCVLLQNNNHVLPLDISTLTSVAVVGPLADDGYEQLGTWIFDGEERHSVSCLSALNHYVNQAANTKAIKINVAKALTTSRSFETDNPLFQQAIDCASNSDVVLLFLGEESILSGEAHSRSCIDLPGAQQALIASIAETGKRIVLVVMAGRPITLEPILHLVDAVLFAWHTGSMAGPAIIDLLFGEQSPSGKLPITFPRNIGQIPLYYAQKNTGKPATDAMFVHQNDIPVRAAQTSLGMAATHLDTHFSPLFPFGFGLSYGEFVYENFHLNKTHFSVEDTLVFSVDVANVGKFDAIETVQLYCRDLVGSVTRPVKELKAFKRVLIKAGEQCKVTFNLATDALAFYNINMQRVIEPGDFIAWVGGCSNTDLQCAFTLEQSQTKQQRLGE